MLPAVDHRGDPLDSLTVKAQYEQLAGAGVNLDGRGVIEVTYSHAEECAQVSFIREDLLQGFARAILTHFNTPKADFDRIMAELLELVEQGDFVLLHMAHDETIVYGGKAVVENADVAGPINAAAKIGGRFEFTFNIYKSVEAGSFCSMDSGRTSVFTPYIPKYNGASTPLGGSLTPCATPHSDLRPSSDCRGSGAKPPVHHQRDSAENAEPKIKPEVNIQAEVEEEQQQQEEEEEEDAEYSELSPPWSELLKNALTGSSSKSDKNFILEFINHLSTDGYSPETIYECSPSQLEAMMDDIHLIKLNVRFR